MPTPDFFSSCNALKTCLEAISPDKRFQFLNHNIAAGELVNLILKGPFTQRPVEDNGAIKFFAYLLGLFDSNEQLAILKQEQAPLRERLLNDQHKLARAYQCFPAATWSVLITMDGKHFPVELLSAIAAGRIGVGDREFANNLNQINAAIASQAKIATLDDLKAAMQLFKSTENKAVSRSFLRSVGSLQTQVGSLDDFFEVVASAKDISTKELLELLGEEWALQHLKSPEALVRVIKSVPKDESYSIKTDWQDVQQFLRKNYQACVTDLSVFKTLYEACDVTVHSSSGDYARDKCIPTELLQVALPLFKDQDGFMVLCRTISNEGELMMVLGSGEFNLPLQISSFAKLLVYLDAISNHRTDTKRQLYPVQEYLLNQVAGHLTAWLTCAKQLNDLEARLVTDEGVKLLYSKINTHLPKLFSNADELTAIRTKHNLPQDKKPGFLAGFFGANTQVQSVAPAKSSFGLH